MNITPNVIAERTPQEKEIFFKHQEIRHKQEAEKLEQEKQDLLSYKRKLIEDVLRFRPDLDSECVKRMSIRTLERIF